LEKELRKLKTKSSALKVTANSLYGSHNYVGSRFYDTEISNAITSIAKEYIKKVDKWTQEISNNKCQVIYGDTDSIFVKLADTDTIFNLAEKIKEGHSFKLSDVPEVQELLEFYESKLPKEMELEFVDLALRIVFAPETKKRYSYVSAVSQELIIIGFEAIRSDTSPFAAEVQKEALKLVLEEGSISKAREKVIELCMNFETLEGKELIEKTTILGPIRRNPNEYKSKTPAIGALEDYAKINQLNINEIWKDFDRFPFIIHEGNVSLYKRSKHPSLVITSKIDKEHYLREALRDVYRIGVKVEMKDIITSSQKTLDHALLFSSGRKKKE
jgi:DNA polymerase elongation subunit (family B)